MTTAQESRVEDTTATHSADLFRMSEFDALADTRSVGEILQANLENAEAQLRIEERRARQAQRRTQDLVRAVNNWHDLIEDYELATHTGVDERRN